MIDYLTKDAVQEPALWGDGPMKLMRWDNPRTFSQAFMPCFYLAIVKPCGPTQNDGCEQRAKIWHKDRLCGVSSSPQGALCDLHRDCQLLPIADREKANEALAPFMTPEILHWFTEDLIP